MSPIDDELRSLLSARAEVVSAIPDPMSGVEQRAKRMRRNRVAASVAGSALVVAAIAVAVPALVSERGGDTDQVATTSTPSASPSVSGPAAALDPQHPWDYRGDPSLVAANEVASLQAEWQAKHPDATVKPLYGAVYESSQRPEITFVSTGGGDDRWGIATSSDAGWTFLHDEVLAAGTTALMAALPGDEAPRLLVVAAPSTGAVEYAPDGRTFRDIQVTSTAPLHGSPGTRVETTQAGIGVTPLQGDTSQDVVRVLDGDGDMDHPVFRGPAPDYAGPTQSSPSPSSPTQPAETTSSPTLAARYAFDPANPWKYRGTTQVGTGDILSADRKQFVTDHGERPGQQDTPLYVVHLSATTDVAVVLHARPGEDWVSFTAHQGTTTHQVAYQPSRGEDILSAYVPLDAAHGLLIGVTSDAAGNLVLQTGSRAEVGGSRTAGIWDWNATADPQARLAAFATGDIEPYSSQPAT